MKNYPNIIEYFQTKYLKKALEDFQTKYLKKALHEGWSIFESDYGLSLEKDDESCIFENDFKAWEFVVFKSLNGSKMHIEALRLLKKYSEKEYNFIMEETKKIQKIHSF